MADEQNTPEAPEVETTEPNEAPKPQAGDVPPEVKRALAKANADAATRLKEFEDRDKSEAQKLAERADAAEKRAAEIEGRALRLEVAAEKGLTPAQAKRLTGSTREELEADAEELKSMFAPSATPSGAALDLGVRGAPAATGGDMNQALRRAAGRA